MADEYIGEWGTISFVIPDFLEEVRDTVNDFAEMLISFLEVANQALEFIKAFIKAFINPLVAIIEAIIEEIIAFLRDLKQIGIYITGDWELLGWPPEDLRGGFQGYERRMIARLTDRTDPTRPDAPSTLKVFAMFGYISVDPTEFERLINFIISMMRLFGLSFFPDTSALPVPVIQSTKYSANIFDFKSLGDTLGSWDDTPPQKTRIVWVTQPASEKHPLNPFPLLGPSGYLITVSTIPDGISLKYARPRGTTDKKGADGDQDKQVQPREYGNVLDAHGQPIKLYGGMEMLDFKGSDFEYNRGIDTEKGTPKDGYCQVFGMLDPASNEILTLENLGPKSDTLGVPGDGKGMDYFLQRTFLITDGVTLAQWFAGEYSAVLDLADMPHHARWEKNPDGQFKVVDEGTATTYYVRVFSTGKQVADEKAVPKWDFQQPKFHAATAGEPFVVNLKSGAASIGNPSQPRKATFVGANTQEYLKALQTALLVLVLTRSDMPTLQELEATKGKETADLYRAGKMPGEGFATNPTGLEGARHLLQRLYPEPAVLEMPNQDPIKWRADLFNNIKRVATELYDKSGTNTRIEKAMVDATPDLRALTVGDVLSEMEGLLGDIWEVYLDGKEDLGLLEAFNPDNPLNHTLNFGFAPNPNSVRMNSTDVEDLMYLERAMMGRETDFVMYEDKPPEMVYEEKDPKKVKALIGLATDGQWAFYQQHIQNDWSLSVPDEAREAMEAKAVLVKRTSSGDKTPVFVVRQDILITLNRNTDYYEGISAQLQASEEGEDEDKTNFLWPAMVFARGALRKAKVQAEGGQSTSPILDQAATILRVAGAEKPPADGEWIAVRFFGVWPEVEEFLRALENWVKALAEALKSVADAIVKYIGFVQAQIAELQQLIRRINALIQSFLSFTVTLPQFSGLLLNSNGTDGVLADLVAAKNKPSDSPRSYGGGVAIVVPFAPSFIFDIIALAAGGQDLNKTTQVTRPPDAIGTEGVEPDAGAAPTDEPDVL